MTVLVGWLALIGGTFSYIATLPRCKVQPELKWWEKTHTYTIYVSSFYDSDGDGVGDIKGNKASMCVVRLNLYRAGIKHL